MGKHQFRRWGVAVIVMCGAATVPLLVGSPAHASHGATANTGVLNTPTWRVCVLGSGSDYLGAISIAITRVNPTDVNASAVSCSAGTANVTTVAASFPDSWYGLTTCGGGVSNGLCANKGVTLNTRTVTTTSQWHKSATHEFGHVAGLGHRSTNNSCMTSGASPPIVSTFDSHDISAINATY